MFSSSCCAGLWKLAGPPFTSLADEAAWWVSTIRREWENAGKPFEEALVDAAITFLEEWPRRRVSRSSCTRIFIRTTFSPRSGSRGS